eukprot:14068587-Alexandrium_andersonii.AAC.1
MMPIPLHLCPHECHAQYQLMRSSGAVACDCRLVVKSLHLSKALGLQTRAVAEPRIRHGPSESEQGR